MVKYLFLVLYIISMIFIGILSARKIRTSGDYIVAGKKGTLLQITGSLIATILGSSAILGTTDLAFSQGWAAAWLLIAASIGLTALVVVAPLVRSQGRYTLPQLIGDQYGKSAKTISSLIIPIAWIGVIAAQIIGGSKIMHSFFQLNYCLGVGGIGILFIFYTVIGGQVSVIKTDLIQSFIIIFGILAIAIYLLFSSSTPPSKITTLHFPFNNGFHPVDLLVLIMTYSTTFLVGPDIYSRLFCASNPSVARRSVVLTAAILLPFAFLITYLGVFAAHHYPSFNFQQGSSLISVLVMVLPDWATGLLVAALLSAVMSSAATTLHTSSVIISDALNNNLDTAKGIRNTKLIIIVMGFLSILLSLKITSIVQSLLIALTFFSGAFIIPVIAGLKGFRTGRWQSNSAMILGGIVALSGKLLSLNGYQMIGNCVIIFSFFLNALLLFMPKKNLIAFRKK